MSEPAGVSADRPPVLSLTPVIPTAVHDADTFRVVVPMHGLLGAVHPDGWEETVRLAHVNAAELAAPGGREARDAVQSWLASHKALTLHCWGREKYGRLLGDLESVDGLLSAFVLGLGGSKPLAVRKQLEVHGGQAGA